MLYTEVISDISVLMHFILKNELKQLSVVEDVCNSRAQEAGIWGIKIWDEAAWLLHTLRVCFKGNKQINKSIVICFLHKHTQRKRKKNLKKNLSFLSFLPGCLQFRERQNRFLTTSKQNKQVISLSCEKDGIRERVYQNVIVRIASMFIGNSNTLNSHPMSLSDFEFQIIVHKHNLDIGKRLLSNLALI